MNYEFVCDITAVGEAMSLPPVLQSTHCRIFVHVGANCVRPDAAPITAQLGSAILAPPLGELSPLGD